MGFPGAYDKTDNGRQISSKLWRDFNPGAIAADPGRGFLYFEDFHREIGAYVDGTLAQNGSAGTGLTTTQNARCIGALTVDAGHTDAGDGPNYTWGGLGFTPAAGTKFAIEFRLEMDMIANMDLFFGAGTLADTAIITATVPAATDVIGLYVADDGADLNFSAINSGGTISTATDDLSGGTFVANTQIKIGFLIDGLDGVELYANGEMGSSAGFLPSAIPDSIIYPKLEVRSGATAVQPTCTVDWMRVGFLGQI